jgi:hypothetical protein
VAELALTADLARPVRPTVSDPLAMAAFLSRRRPAGAGHTQEGFRGEAFSHTRWGTLSAEQAHCPF